MHAIPYFPLLIKSILIVSLQAQIDFCLAQTALAKNPFVIDAGSEKDTVEWERERESPSAGMLQDFNLLFNTIHGSTSKIKFNKVKGLKEIVYDSVAKVYYGRTGKEAGLMRGTELMAWHAHWMTEEYKYYPYHLLSTIAFFAYDIDPETGLYTDADAINRWNTTGMIDSAKRHDVSILLTLTSYGTTGNRIFLENTNAWIRLSDSLRLLLRKRNAQGVDVDFSGMTRSMTNSFTEFVTFLRRKLGDSAVITLQIPYNTTNEAYDFDKLKDLVNTFIIKGYNIEKMLCDDTPILSAPLYSQSSSCRSIENAFRSLLAQGLRAKNIIVSMPLYGARWTRREFVDYVAYEDIRALYSVRNQRVTEKFNNTVIRVGEGDEQEEIWYETTENLSRKFRWIKDEGLSGAGLWGIGYDGNDPEIWDSVRTGFGASDSQMVPLESDNGKLYSLMYSLQRYRKILGVSLSIVICFFVAGLLLSFLDWRVRKTFFDNQSYRGILAAAIVLAAMLAIYLLSDNHGQTGDRSFTTFCYGVLTGGSIVYIISSIYLYYRKKLH